MSIVMNKLYKIKFYFDISVSQISWITGKLPELMALVYLLEKFEVIMGKQAIILTIITGFIGLTLFGFVWKKIGYYDIEQYVLAEKNPVQKELLKAVRKINSGGKK